MSIFGKAIIGAFSALVAGTAMVVHGCGDKAFANVDEVLSAAESDARRLAVNEHVQPKTSGGVPPSDRGGPAEETKQEGEGAEPQFDVSSLPEPVRENLADMVQAAQSGNLEAMRPVLESNGLKPMVRNGPSTDPIAYWREQSVDGSGRDILAAILNVFSSGFVKVERQDSVMYIWPYFAERDLSKLTPVEQVELFRVVPAKQAARMMEAGKYTGYRAGISDRGILHYFKK